MGPAHSARRRDIRVARFARPRGARPAKWPAAKSTRRFAAIFCNALAASLALLVARATKPVEHGRTNHTYCSALFSQAFGTCVDVKERTVRAPERSGQRQLKVNWRQSGSTAGHRAFVCIRVRVRRQCGLRRYGEKDN